MPAMTVNDLTVLPRVAAPAAGSTPRPVVSISSAPSSFEGEGFPVKRAFAGVDLRLLDPFIHMDEMGEVDYAPGEPKGTPWHPHQRRHPVDDRRLGDPAHRGPAGASRRQRRPVPRLPAVGEPAEVRQAAGPALPGPALRRGLP